MQIEIAICIFPAKNHAIVQLTERTCIFPFRNLSMLQLAMEEENLPAPRSIQLLDFLRLVLCMP